MPRENSFSDSDGRSLTPDLEDELDENMMSPISPTYGNAPRIPSPIPHIQATSPPGITSAASIRSRRTERSARPPKVVAGAEKFRRAVRKIIQMHRGTSYLVAMKSRVGAEPGVDPRRASANINYGHIKQDCVIELADYSAVRSSFGRMTNREFINLVQDERASAREPWVKVRWINVHGVSWDVISAIALKYSIHPLALEDVLHQRGQTRSKVDYYSQHLFMRVLCHELGDEADFLPSDTAAFGSTLTDAPRSSSPEGFTSRDKIRPLADEEATIAAVDSNQSTSRFKTLLPHHHEANRLDDLAKAESQARDKRIRHEIAVQELKKEDRVIVNVKPMYIFLLRDGTVISIHPTPTTEFTSPIAARLKQRDTGLRSSADPSLLVQSLLDLIVDQALEVVDAYANQIKVFEKDILLKSKMKTVRALHVLSGDLILHKRTLEPIKTILYGLRRYDLDRCAALVDTTSTPGTKVQVVGYMTHKSKIYLADVHDHMEYILASIDMFANISDNLIDYSFNMASYQMNETMRRLTLITIIFLPLTLLTGYFGMNFEVFWAIHNKSDLVFWIIAIPMMAVFMPLALFGDLRRFILYAKKKMSTKKAVKAYKQS